LNAVDVDVYIIFKGITTVPTSIDYYENEIMTNSQVAPVYGNPEHHARKDAAKHTI
jgi:hypothetical protein